MFWNEAFAQAAQAVPGKPSLLESLFPFVLIFLVFYFLIIRPQGKQKAAHMKLLNELKKGDKVLTAGGIFGTIEGLTDKFVTLEVDKNVRLKVLRSQVSGLAKEGEGQ